MSRSTHRCHTDTPLNPEEAHPCPTGEHPKGWQHTQSIHNHCTICGVVAQTNFHLQERNDLKDELLHRVKLVDLEKYKADVVKEVTALCGKTWAPTFPIKHVDKLPKCPICFPVEIYQMAVAK